MQQRGEVNDHARTCGGARDLLGIADVPGEWGHRHLKQPWRGRMAGERPNLKRRAERIDHSRTDGSGGASDQADVSGRDLRLPSVRIADEVVLNGRRHVGRKPLREGRLDLQPRS